MFSRKQNVFTFEANHLASLQNDDVVHKSQDIPDVASCLSLNINLSQSAEFSDSDMTRNAATHVYNASKADYSYDFSNLNFDLATES